MRRSLVVSGPRKAQKSEQQTAMRQLPSVQQMNAHQRPEVKRGRRAELIKVPLKVVRADGAAPRDKMAMTGCL